MNRARLYMHPVTLAKLLEGVERPDTWSPEPAVHPTIDGVELVPSVLIPEGVAFDLDALREAVTGSVEPMPFRLVRP